ncbi:hypothetical protein HAX54_050278 [Datura stramonium]|uniref:Uncharacterized protein n=1 Tax=Datura stramonium TaxID=4076 RepID=A0ABS8SWT1_DATST|nr:hypothetical protein [Datura stramonium]
MSMIINELYPPVVANAKKKKVKEVQPSQGIRVAVPVLALHHDPKIWGEDAHLSNPERLYEGNAEATNGNPSALQPLAKDLESVLAQTLLSQRPKATSCSIIRKRESSDYYFSLTSANSEKFSLLTKLKRLGAVCFS